MFPIFFAVRFLKEIFQRRRSDEKKGENKGFNSGGEGKELEILKYDFLQVVLLVLDS